MDPWLPHLKKNTLGWRDICV